jgi:L-ascorbate metabolism protein UlaG (beta-lactamase superfamily)
MAPEKDKSIYHANPGGSFKYCQRFKSKKVLGMHFGTVVLSLEPILDPPKRFKNAANQHGYHEDDAIIFKIGEVQN